MSCLSDQAIAQYVEAALDDETTALTEQHIDGCVDCRMAVAAAARGQVASSPSLSPSSRAFELVPRAQLPPLPALLPGVQLGRYIVRRVVGAGGMGMVYAAYDPTLDREIALKLVRPLLTGFTDERGFPERLLREAQLMARLTHPNVIMVHDIGAIEGQVFVAMELVIGETLRHKLRSQSRRAWREVLALFLAAGRGLSAAHRMHIVHRDFKPDNVLVSQDGRVQVTDFGLARMVRSEEPAALPAVSTGGPGSPEGHLTRTGALVGTPAYMAPEQLRGGAADERSDQFAFCVALYEGLYGERPFTEATTEALVAAIENGVDPRDASVPAWLRRVVLRGLRAQPSERWPSMEALITALTRNPVDRFWRWVATATLLTLLGVGGAAAIRRPPPVQTCRGAAERLLGVWNPERRQTVHRAFAATQMPYAEDAFAGVSRALDAYGQAWAAMYTEACEATWLRGEQSAELLDLRMHCLERARQELQARVAIYETADVEGVRRAVSVAPAVAELRLCADTKELLQPVRLPADRAAKAHISTLEQRLAGLRARYQAGQYQQSLQDAQRMASEAANLTYPPLEAEAQLLLGDFQQAVGAFADAESAFYRALWAGEAGKQDRIATQAWTRLVYLVGDRQDRAAESQRLVQHAEAALRRLGGDDIEAATLESAAGSVAWKTGRYDEAMRRFGTSRALFEKTLGVDSLEVAEVLQRTSFALEPLGKFEEAIALERRGLDILTKRLGPAHPEVAAGRLRLGEHLMINEYYTPALIETKGALDIYERSDPADDIHVASALYGVASVLTEMQRGQEALPLIERALYIRKQRLGPVHSEIGRALEVYSSALLQAGQTERALAEALRVRTILAQTLGTDHVYYSFALLDLGRIYSAKRDYQRARVAYRESLAVLKRSQVTDVWCIARPQLAMARDEIALGHIPAAIATLEETLAMLDHDDPTTMFLGDACFQLAQALALAHRDEQRVQSLLQRAIALYGKVDAVRAEEQVKAKQFLAKRPRVK